MLELKVKVGNQQIADALIKDLENKGFVEYELSPWNHTPTKPEVKTINPLDTI